ncbi:hypothetical protein PIB30_087180, partial [Stylosanthes scabra]|nr:hypothetical protein [Stylosanthes scabra]
IPREHIHPEHVLHEQRQRHLLLHAVSRSHRLGAAPLPRLTLSGGKRGPSRRQILGPALNETNLYESCTSILVPSSESYRSGLNSLQSSPQINFILRTE